jgi:hypothetical protein
MKSSSPVTKGLLLAGFVIITIFGLRYVLQMVLHAHDVATIKTLDDAIQNERNFIATTADLTRQNAVDESTSKVLIDCSTAERQRFDLLLDELSKNISADNLHELAQLFYKCGSFSADQKGIMAAKLEREVDVLANLKTVRNHIQTYPEDMQTEITVWKKIAESELKWAAYSGELVTDQGLIIELFLKGKNASSPEVVEILTKASNAKSQMVVLGDQIKNYRQTVPSI